MYRSLTLSDEQEGRQLVAAPISTPGFCDYGQKYQGGCGGGGRFGTFTLCNNNNKMKEILPQTRHTIHMVINMTFFFFSILKYLFLNIMSALEINHVFIHDASIISGVK